ncbi:hypothetical protein RJ640_027562 [Escallonia rubra]|uniref:Haloacid dehalogenase-like hydrolase domain-containing protein Sgpp n=1 Tax=Escallonia rubra TaxID=112253 RepID=A0AA88QFY4_9ASTE|nr:hypothetical protein RJ640_027562 [Escallonia rubra]
MELTRPSFSPSSNCSLAFVAPLEAILFDIDGTLCDSDPIHYDAFREMLQEKFPCGLEKKTTIVMQVGFRGGVPIDEEFFVENIAGKHNEELCRVLLPDWDFERAMKFMIDKEAMFRRLASDKLGPIKGLGKLNQWVEDRGLIRGAVTNAPRSNAELLISMLGLSNFFKTVVIANECDRAKPFPDPYLKALYELEVSPKHTFVFEDSVSGIKAGVAAGMPVVGLATRNPEKVLVEAGATFVIKDYDDPKLWTALQELVKKAEVIEVTP